MSEEINGASPTRATRLGPVDHDQRGACPYDARCDSSLRWHYRRRFHAKSILIHPDPSILSGSATRVPPYLYRQLSCYRCARLLDASRRRPV